MHKSYSVNLMDHDHDHHHQRYQQQPHQRKHQLYQRERYSHHHPSRNDQENAHPGPRGIEAFGAPSASGAHAKSQSYQQRFVPPQFTPYGDGHVGAGDGTLPSPRRRKKIRGGGGGEDKARRRRLYVTQQQEIKSLAAPQAAMNMWFLAIGAGAVMVVLLAVGDLLLEALWSSANDMHPHVAQLCAIIVGGGWLMLILVFWLASRGVT